MHKVLIYSDEGVNGGALKHLFRSLQQELDPQLYFLERVDAKGLIESDWEREAALLIIPGGRDLFYHAKLDGAGTERIRRFVAEGGSYLGICAGAYFGCGAIEFEKGGPLEVCGERSLKFFPGSAIGPAYGPNKYSYLDARGVEAAKISVQAGECAVYFNGGCLFSPEAQHPGVNVVSRYLDLPGKPPAILAIEWGKGLAVLSGVHFEYLPRLLSRSDPYLNAIVPLLEEMEGRRRALFRLCLERLLKKDDDKCAPFFYD
jgi:biotin--protein ligase